MFAISRPLEHVPKSAVARFVPPPPLPPSPHTAPSQPQIRARNNNSEPQTGILCDVGGEDAAPHGPLTANAEESGDKIAKMSGTCAVAAGPRVCAEVACTRNAAVWLCNDNVAPIAPLCSSLASYVADIVSTCGSEYYHGSRYCRGQEFDSDNYNIIVGWKSQC
ncbi:hypothetical protein ANO14919_090320 [Xylariales sp. No.14919]|nr:hypothetical protein ANO14919_090320 [Xylariales sp. No.14919]